MIETVQKCCDKVKTKQEKKTEENEWLSDSFKKINFSYILAAHECISFQLLSPNKRVWSLSFTTEVFSSQGLSPMTGSRPCKNFLYSIEIFSVCSGLLETGYSCSASANV